MNAYTDIGTALKAVRLARGIGLRQASRELDVAGTTIWRIETGRMEPSYAMLERLCGFYGVNVTIQAEGGVSAWLIEREETQLDAAV